MNFVKACFADPLERLLFATQISTANWTLMDVDELLIVKDPDYSNGVLARGHQNKRVIVNRLDLTSGIKNFEALMAERAAVAWKQRCLSQISMALRFMHSSTSLDPLHNSISFALPLPLLYILRVACTFCLERLKIVSKAFVPLRYVTDFAWRLKKKWLLTSL